MEGARSDALDRVQELHELTVRHGSVVKMFDSHLSMHARMKEKVGGRMLQMSHKVGGVWVWVWVWVWVHV